MYRRHGRDAGSIACYDHSDAHKPPLNLHLYSVFAITSLRPTNDGATPELRCRRFLAESRGGSGSINTSRRSFLLLAHTRLGWLITLNSYGDGTFAAAGARLWNSFPVQLRNHLRTVQTTKGHRCLEAWPRRSVTSDMRRQRKQTYLLTYLQCPTLVNSKCYEDCVERHKTRCYNYYNA